MKKNFTKLGIVLIASATILPLSACTFNFYINRVTNSIAKSFADQTSALIKSMVMSKELDSDTNSTNDDIMGQIKNSSINNLTKNTTLDNWGDLQSRWGENGNIDIKGFNPDEFFKASGTGQLTKDINSKKNINNIFSNLSYVWTISIMSNRELVNIIKGTGFNPISTFLKTLQGDLSDKPAALQLLINLINNYGPNFLTPLNNIFNNLINGSWSDNQVTTPNNLEELTTFMTNWKDDSDQPYSAWNDGTTWKLDPSILVPSHKVTEWKAKEDYDLYHGGTLINYLFWKISKDHDIVGEKNKNPRYLGEIIEEHIKGTYFDVKAFLVDILQYVPFLTTNPRYILIIVEALIPVIKKWILEMPDITEGVKYLTIGNGYPSNPTTGSYNLLNITNTIKSLLNNPDKLKEILKIAFGRPPTDNPGFDTFLYDVKVKITYNILSITTSMGALFANLLSPDLLINPIIEAINNDSVKSTINDVVDLLTEISKQYPNNEGINIDLEKLKTFLLNNETGLLVILKNDTIVVLKNIIKQSDVTSSDIDELYQSLGGHVNKENPDFPIFTSGSILDILQKTMLQQDSELNKILNLMLGTTDENRKLGIADIITANNNKWIKDNYNAYFDADNTTGINKKIANTYNITMTKSTTNTIETVNLKYDFVYKINNKTYHFIITAINIENLIDFQGIRTFKFKSISLVT
ncbi:hypothetical protein [Spiroplasma endosymbiont of Polydrusus pterygomalis]|uniref:hypothetical protein n=1 Tax=Spiroplasma endosymbiont of Polydrusus pterygomalis TaxID=3139327 RepID=UPI003CCA7685